MRKTGIYIISSIIVLCILITGAFALFRKQEPAFQGFIEASQHITTYEETLEEAEYLAEVRIIRKLSRREAEKLNGYGGQMCEDSTFFEAEINYDYLTNEKIDKKIYLAQFGTEEWQMRGDPIFITGDIYLIFLSKTRRNDEFYGPYGGPNSVFDIKEKYGERFIYKRLGDFGEFEDIKISFSKEETEEFKQKNKVNPVSGSQKFKLSDFASKVKNDYERRKNK